jgi:predicted transcriptional regulator
MEAPARKPVPELGDLERAVLDHLWSVQDSDVGEMHRAVGSKRGISANTIGSTLERLYRKGLANREKVSHAYRYRAALSREQFAAQMILAAAGGSKALTETGLLSSFLDVVTAEDRSVLDRLERLIAEKRREGR